MSPVRKNPQSLSKVVKIGAVVFVVCLGMWGCARKPASRLGDNTVLETKVTKLEQDLRTASGARDKARKDLANLEAESARLQKEAKAKLEATQADRDDLRQQVSQRIVERDNFGSRVDKLRKGMQQLMSQDESPATPTPGSTPTPAAMIAGPRLGGNS